MHHLPLTIDIETKTILKASLRANEKLAELKGLLRILPNPTVILNAITLREAKESSEIENIVTTYDEIYREMTSAQVVHANAKEVLNYRRAIMEGYRLVKEKKLISTNMLIQIHAYIEPSNTNLRTSMGTVIQNSKTKEIIHTPPQSKEEVLQYMRELEIFINDDSDNVDALIKMAVLHLQFEMIHPFYDGNGRTGRILNILYLILKNKLDFPILYLSKYIIDTKDQYYQFLQAANQKESAIADFILYILKGIEVTSEETMKLIRAVRESMEEAEKLVKAELPKIYSKELIELLYYEFYTKNVYLCEELSISRNTADKYLKQLESVGLLEGQIVGRDKLYKNLYLYRLTEVTL